MEHYLVGARRVRAKKEKWSRQKLMFERMRACLLRELETLPEIKQLCSRLCAHRSRTVAASLALPGIAHEVSVMGQETESRQQQLQQSLQDVNLQLKQVEERLSHLESPEYREQLIRAAVEDAVQRAEVLLEQYKRQHAAVHEVLERALQELRSKQTITTQDVEDLAEEVEKAIEEPQPESVLSTLRRSLLEEIQKGTQLQPVSPQQRPALVTPTEREKLFARLARSLTQRRQVLEGGEEEAETEEEVEF